MGSVYDLFARLVLDSSEYEKGLDDAKGQASGAGNKIGSALKSGFKVAAAAVSAASTAVVAFAKSSVDAGVDFDSAMAQVAATSGKSMKELAANVGTAETAYGHFEGNLRDFAQFMGANTSFSATQAAEALNYMALAGYDAQQSMNMLPTVLDLAAAGGIDLAYASDMVTDAQSALGLSAEQTTDMVNQMALASSKTNTSVSQLGEAMLTIGATARSVKGGTVELSTILGVLADNGIKGGEGGTHLRNIIMSLQNPTKDAAARLEKMNISLYDGEGNMRSLIDVVADLQKGMEGMSDAARDAVISDIFNKTDAAAVNALLNTTTERYSELTQQISNADGAAQRMAATQLDNLAGDMTLFQSALEGAKIAISDKLTPALRSFVQFGTNAVSELGTAFKEKGLEGALEALGPIVNKGIELVFQALPKVLNAGVALLNALVNAIITNLPALVPAAVQIVEMIGATLLNAENITQLMDAGFQIIMMLADALIDGLPELIPAIVDVILTIVEKLTDPDTVVKLNMAALQIMLAIMEGLIKALPQLLAAVPVIIMNLVQSILGLKDKLLDAGGQLLLSLRDGVKAKVSDVLSALRDMGNAIADTVRGLVNSALSWGRDLIGNFINGIKEKWNALKNTIGQTAQSIKSYLGFSEPEKGPLSNFHTYAPDMMELFAKGIRDNTHLVTDQLQESLDFGRDFGWTGTTNAGAAQVSRSNDEDKVLNIYLGNELIYSGFAKWQKRQQLIDGGRA